MPKSIKPGDLGAAIAEQLALYGEEVTEAVDAAGLRAIKKLVKRTQDTAPVRTGGYFQAITFKTVKRPSGSIYIWGAGAQHGRLTHLLVKGHPTGNGGRTNGDPFLQNALDEVLPEYEAEVEEALRSAK
jgi:hypothetical protein